MAMTRREFLGNSLAVGTVSLVSHRISGAVDRS